MDFTSGKILHFAKCHFVVSSVSPVYKQIGDWAPGFHLTNTLETKFFLGKFSCYCIRLFCQTTRYFPVIRNHDDCDRSDPRRPLRIPTALSPQSAVSPWSPRMISSPWYAPLPLRGLCIFVCIYVHVVCIYVFMYVSMYLWFIAYIYVRYFIRSLLIGFCALCPPPPEISIQWIRSQPQPPTPINTVCHFFSGQGWQGESRLESEENNTR